MKAWKGKATKKKGRVKRSCVVQKRRLKERRGHAERPVEVSVARVVYGRAAEDKDKLGCKRRTGNSLSLSVPCSI